MEKKESPNFSSAHQANKTTSPDDDDELQELLQTLEQQTNWDGRRLIKYDGFWCDVRILRPILSARKHFKAENSDVILASFPKSGTTWLKALIFSIVNRNIYTIDQTPLLTSLPHEIVRFLEFDLFRHQENPDLKHIPSPKIFSTHIPFRTLPESIRDSECKIIYTCRNPLDQFISQRQFLLEIKIEKDAVPLGLDEAFDMFCQGIQPFGPFWDHMLGYWKAHLDHPEKVLFLKYEDLKEDVAFYIKKIAEFLGCPFSMDEEKQGVNIEEIARLCSFENLKNLEVNKTGQRHAAHVVLKNSAFFRKGQVGDWTNYLTPAMADRVKKIMETKFEGSGLMFNMI